MTERGLYSIAHLMAATIRIFEYQKGHPPSIEQVCETLSFTSEQGHIYLNKLTELGIMEVVEGNFGTRIFLRDHLKIEEIPKDSKESGLGDAVKEFQDSRKKISEKIASIQADQAKKKKDLFAELESQLKKKLDK
jgi:hypothetical protein